MPRSRKKRTVRKAVQKKIDQEFSQLMDGFTWQPFVVPMPQWTRLGDQFTRFSLYDESLISFSSDHTVLLPR